MLYLLLNSTHWYKSYDYSGQHSDKPDYRKTRTTVTSWIPTNLEMSSIIIIFTSNRSLEFSSCFKSFSAKSGKNNRQYFHEDYQGWIVKILSLSNEDHWVKVEFVFVPKANDKRWKSHMVWVWNISYLD